MATKRPRGRPPFKPTRAMRTTVERMLACGDAKTTIARAFGIDEDTLRKHFAEELAGGAARRRREAVEMVFRGAKAGNTALIKRVEEMTRASSSVDFGAEIEQALEPALKRGKKEVRHDEAKVAGQGTEWGDDLAPLAGPSRLN